MKSILKRSDILVLVPVFNEEESIAGVIDNIRANLKEVDILIINDGSTDTSAEKAEKKGVFVINHPFNMGIGTSLQTGCRFAAKYGYRYVIRIDGDGQHDAAFADAMLSPVKEGIADITMGSRFLGQSKFKSSFPRLAGIYIISWFLKIITGKKVTDPTSGFCALNKKACAFLSENCVEDYPEPEILVYHKEFRIREIPISINKRLGGVSSITPFMSVYYIFKVLLSLFMHMFRKENK